MNDYVTYQASPQLTISYVIGGIISIIGLWQIFKKAGKPGWAAIIPIYNIIVLLEIVGKPLWWFLLLLVPCVNFIFIPWVINMLSKSFGKGIGFTLGLIFLGPIFTCILGFGDAVYLGPGGPPVTYGADDYQKPFDINP
jgi:hypothetical protein